MKVTTYSYFHTETGVFATHFLQSNAPPVEDASLLYAPDGHCAIEGQYDPFTQKVDVDVHKQIKACDAGDVEKIAALKAVLIVDHVPPAPSADHVWHGQAKRWLLKEEIRARNQAVADAQLELQRLDVSHLRALDEAFDDPTNVDARLRLSSIRKKKKQLRDVINPKTSG